MTTLTKPTILALAALLVCSACSDKPMKTSLINAPNQQLAAIKWDEATAATSSARVYNNGLIMMR